MQQRSGLNANAVCRITAVLLLASYSSPGGMTRTNANESVEHPVLEIVARLAVASAECSTIDIRSRCALWVKVSVEEHTEITCITGWLNRSTADIKSRS